MMTYEEARSFMDEVNAMGIMLGTDTMQNLLSELDNPQDMLQFVHIAGTNGKGSTLAFISNILQCAGYTVGRYASPRVFAYEEFVQVNCENIEKDAYCKYVTEIRDAIKRIDEKGLDRPSCFEIETAIGFLYFIDKKCDVVVLECGMGGRDDATNVVDNVLCNVIVPIGMDHMGYLGNTIEEIADVKAGIIKSDAPVCVGRQPQSVIDVIAKASEAKNAPMFVIDESAIQAHESLVTAEDGAPEIEFDYKDLKNLRIRLMGRYQLVNAALAIEAAKAINGARSMIETSKDSVFTVNESSIRSGLERASWPGRFETIHKDPVIIVDGAHNPHGIEQLKNSLEYYYPGKKLIGVMGVLADKAFDEEVEMVAPLFDKMFTITPPNNPRALDGEKLAKVYEKCGLPAVSCASIEEAVKLAAQAAGEDNTVIVFGSLSYIGEAVAAARSL